MADRLTIPTTEELDARIKACEEELRELKRLRRMARSAEIAEQARKAREVPSAKR